jgi:putative zinc finger/helix-turn-helix YgiT family protein
VKDRKHLTTREVEKLLAATKGTRNEARDRCLLLLTFRHGLRVSEACALTLAQVDTESRVLHVSRLKKGLSTTHPLRPEEIRCIRKKQGLTQEAAGLMIGGGPRAFQKYESGDLLPSRAISSALVLLDRDPRALAVLKARQVKPSTTRHNELRP